MVTMHAVLFRRADLTHEQFLTYWHETHGPLIRNDESLTRHLLAYEQHPRLAGASLGREADQPDGVTVQRFASWDAFLAMLSEPGAQAMNDDMANFLDVHRLTVAFTTTPVPVV
jgi:uncharacterized protein (TIGR02118 family)